MKTLLGTEIPKNTLAVLYLCRFDQSVMEIKVTRELFFDDVFAGMTAYAEIPNPESQLAAGANHEILKDELSKLHDNMSSKKWLNELSECI